MRTRFKRATLLLLALIGLSFNPVWARNYTLSHSGADSTTIAIIDCPTDPNKFNVIRDGEQLQYDYDALGNITSSGKGAVNIEFYTTHTVLMNGNVEVTGNNARLYFQKKVVTEAELPTLKRNSASGNLFSANSKGMLYIYGYDNTRGGHFIIDSGAVYPEPYDARVKKSEVITRKAGRIIRADRNLTLQYVTLQNAFHDEDFGGAAIGCKNAEGPNGTGYTIDVRDAVIRGCFSRQGTAMMFYETDYHEVYCKRLKVYGCHSTLEVDDALGSGIFRSWGNCCGSLTLDSCNIHHNLSDYGGGAVYWNASGRGEACKLYVTGHTILHDNEAKKWGGAIVAKSNVEIDTAEIYNNVAPIGGGIFSTPYTGGMTAYSGQGTILQLGGSVSIHDNEATIMGGGVYYAIYKSNDVGFTPSGASISPEYRLDVMDGADIYHNKAPKGAGIAVNDYAPFRHLNNREGDNAYNVWSKEIRRSLTITGGVVRDNYCTAEAEEAQGAGFYIWKHKATDGAPDGSSESLGYTWAQAKGAGTMNVNIYGGLIQDNVARNNNHNGVGGGFYIENTKYTTANYTSYCPVTIGDPEGVGEGVTIEGNTSDGNGAGIYIATGDLTVYGGSIGTVEKPNITYNGNGGAVYLADGNITVNGGNVKYNQAKHDSEYGGGNGGAFYLVGGIASIRGGSVSHNTADLLGGGFYIDSDDAAIDTIHKGADISHNEAVNGGGVYVENGSLLVLDATTNINNNTASSSGGGLYIAGGNITVNGANVTGNESITSGGGMFVAGGNAQLTNTDISSNSATNLGGGIYMEGGACTLSSGANIGGTDASHANSALRGGGIYSAGGTITVKGGHISYNTATDRGGGIYSNDKAKVYVQADNAKNASLSYIEHNSAPYGGGIYAEKGLVEFSDGYIQYNHASEQGGGIFVDANDTLYLKGSANLYRNHVPEDHNGGGVYLVGSLIVGEAGATGVIKAQENYAGDEYVYEWNDTGHPATDSIDQVTANNRNNIFLPTPTVNAQHKGVITVIEGGITNESRVGFSVPRNYVPVIYCAPSSTNQAYLNQFSTGHENQYMLFDDTRHYVAVHYSDKPEIFDPNHVYLYGFWSNIVTGQEEDPCYVNPSTFDPMDIKDPCELAFFISWVNGLNGQTAHPTSDGKLTADIDMSEYGWVPIGHLTEGYQGTFDGDGHTVSGISSLLYRDYLDYGFFGRLNGGTVKNLFVEESVYAIESKDGIIIGGIAAEATGNSLVENTEVKSIIVGDHPNTIMGGLIGRMGDVQESTTSDWTVSGNQVPVNGTKADHFQKSEFVIPASELAGMEGASLGSMQFFLSSPASKVWQDASFQVFIKPVTNTTLSGFSGTDGATVVYTGGLDATGYTMNVNFNTAYTYNGGNLLVGIYLITPGEAHSASFQGVDADNASYHGESDTSLEAITTGSAMNFRPKVVLAASAQQTLVADGTTTSTAIPVNGSKINSFNKMEFIVPASELLKVEGGSLNQMQFFLSSQAANTWGNAEFRVFLKEVDRTTVNGFSGTDDATIVYEGKLFGNAPTMTVDFTTPYEYSGGNLLVGIYQYKKGTNRAATFVGVEAEDAAICGSHSSNINNVVGINTHFRPKTVFSAAETVVHNMVCDGAVVNQSIPVCGSSVNKYQKNEFVIPASDLTDMNGAEISSMKFYLSSPARDVWGSAKFQVFLKEVENTTINGFTGLDGASLVYEGVLDATSSTMVVYFNNMYTYQGGNLLVGIYQTVIGTDKEATFAGIEIANAGIHGESTSSLDAITEGTMQNFRPKTVFGYTPTSATSPIIHSTIAIGNLNGFLMGGLVGQIVSGTLSNSYANSKFTYNGTTQYNGGLVGINRGTVESSYARLRDNVSNDHFGILVGDNTNGTVNYCYAPAGMTNYVKTGNDANGSGNYAVTELPYLYKHRDTQVDANNDYVPTGADADKQLMNVLNRWVDTINSKQSSINYTKWGRPWQESDAVKPLNDDYPILRMPKAEAVAAKADDPYLYYNPVDSLLVRYTDAESAIWVYRNPSDTVRGDNSTSAAKLYIAEDVVLLNDNPLKAYVGITLDNSAGINGAHPTYGSVVGVETDETDWHMIATPLSDAPIGINYDNGTYDFDYGHPSGMPYYLFYPKDDAKHGYFPSHRFGESYPSSDATIEAGNYYTEWDFYSYSEPEFHWINFKRNSASHHHMEVEDHPSIAYDNETRLVPGKGYFAATREETFLQCQGHLNNGAVAYGLTQTSGVPRHGYNLIGNPYQAYLNFDAFADANSGDGDNKIWAAASNASYTILDEDEPETSINVETVMGQKPVFYRTYSYGCSDNPDVSAGGFIHPHQGFFVRLEGDKASAQAQFAPDQRNATDTVGSKFRGAEHIDYPLVNLFAIEGNGAADVVTVELGRPDEGGAPLMQSLRVGNGKIWCHYDDKDYAIAYTQPGITEVGIRFETVEDTEYTMRWSTRNGDFSYLHLIDNKTGADVDCLTTDEYKFSASTSDYKSRFRLVFGYTGIEEDTEAEANENFAFMMNDALVVTGEGVLQVFDMTGRMVASQELHGVQTTVSLPNAANGVYVLRLTNGRQSQVQKMVISK